MKKTLLILFSTLLLQVPRLHAAEAPCGDDGVTCGDTEICCEHVIAMFSGDSPASPPYVEGECLPKESKCSHFWCGSRQCNSGIFGAPSVCCISTSEEGAIPQYSCAFSELNCPGNSQQLTIRDSQPSRTLRRS